MKRILSLTLALVMVLGTFTGVFAAEPTVEEAAGKFLESVGVLLGDDEGNLNLNENLERRDAVILLSRLLGAEEVAAEFPKSEESPSWTDVRTDEYYVSFFAWAEANGYFEGNDDNTFAPREAISAPEYALVLLRALGYEANGYESWKAALKTAKELGLLEDVEVEFEDKVVRGQMAVMTLNALGTKVKDSEKTLAETLEIELPVPAKLEIEDVFADNLKEVKVAFNKDIDVDLTDIDLFSIKGLNVEDATVDGEELILTLESNMKNKKEYELVIKGTEELDGKFKFTAYDNAVPVVEEVVALGTKAIKVVMSEPVKNPQAKNFRLDGKLYFGSVESIGREIILTPYGGALTIGDHELVVSSLEDYANFKSLETLVEFEVVEDKVAPEVVDVTGTLERIVVTFSEDVDSSTVKKDSLYWNKKANTGKPVRLAGNKYAFEFEDSLPIYEVTLHIQGVKDYSGNEMKAVEMPFKGILDDVRPEVVDSFVTKNTDLKEITVKFSKVLDKASAEKSANYTLKDEDSKVVRVREVKLDENKKDVQVKLYNSLKNDKDYTLEIEGVQDNTKLKNTMLPYETTITVGSAAVDTKVVGVSGNEDDKTIHVLFSKKMDLATLADEDNYIIYINNKGVVLSAIEDAELDVVDGGKAVIITLPNKHDSTTLTLGTTVDEIGVIGVKDTDGNLIDNHGEKHTIELDDAKVKEAVAKAGEDDEFIVTVEFDQAIEKVSKDDFNFSGNVKVEDAVANGTKKVELTVTGLSADARETFTIVNSPEIRTVLGKKAVTTTNISLKDKIAPSLVLNSARTIDINEAVYGNVYFELEFDEALDTSRDHVFAQAIRIERANGAKVLERGVDFITESVSGNAAKVRVTITNNDILSVASEYIVSIDVEGHIKDVEGNVVNKSKEATFEVTDAQALKAEGNVLTELENVVNKLDVDADETINEEYVKAYVEGLVDLEKVTVKVEKTANDDEFKVTLTSKNFAPTAKSKDIIVKKA